MTEPISIPNDEFIFVGEHSVLDFINTEIVVRGKPRELLATPAALGRWWRAVKNQHPHLSLNVLLLPDEEILHRGKAFRGTLRRLITHWIRAGQFEEADLQRLNHILSEAVPTLSQHENGIPETRYLPRSNAPDALFLPFAIETLQLLTTVERERLHECHNDRCVLLFLDTTRSKTRQWCSLACLERERSRRRHKEWQLRINNE